MLVSPLLRRAFSLFLSLMMGAAPIPALEDDALQRGIALVNEGDFEAAVVALDTALRALEGKPGSEKHRAQAQLYLGVAYLELDQEGIAKAKFREALRLDPQLRLDPEQFSPQVIRTFEAARLEAAPPATGRPTVAARPTEAEEGGKKKNKALPILLVAGGGAAIVGVALASGAGGGGGAATTSTTIAVGGTPTTTTTTTTTTAPPAPTTTTTTAPPPPPAPACSYSMTPDSQSFSGQAQDGACQVITRAGCQWGAEATRDWLSIQSGSSGSGNGTVTFRMTANTDRNSRDGRIRLRNTDAPTDARCEIVQAGSGATSQAVLTWTGTLDVADGAGQVIVDGAVGAFQERISQRSLRTEAGDHRIEAFLVTGGGRPGTWRFELAGTFEAGSLRLIAGDVLAVTVDAIVFRMSGRPGERVGFAFKTAR